MRICQVFHKIRCHGAPLLQSQLQTGKLLCNSEPDFMLFALALQIIVINFNDVIFTADTYESAKDVCFTDV